ncbi:hypothetical protein K0504_09860 [Neiella marina]|uniref:Uncharacterized protein n=1 Tax=Neiella holothuriorum TaxID=2870530 RepID=A0ABS7EG80_9GAMM|nr:hypothetical protein [Neiella holothuriorum]MBW8191342.1 hypothetical protein [Neiella holothuriorum]
MKSTPKTIHSAYPVGMVCTLGRACLGNPAGALAIVVEQYKIGEHHGITLLCQNGSSDGFSEECMLAVDVVPSSMCKKLADYQFISVIELTRDYQSGLFNEALN